MADSTITSKNNIPEAKGAPATPTTQVVNTPVSYENVVAKPLRTPNFLNLKHKNPSMSLYWGNYRVGEKESSLRFNQLVAMGFVTAKPQDITDQTGNPCPDALIRDGKVIYGDIILLMIPKKDYLGALKWNAENAARRVKKFGVAIDGSGKPRSVLADLPRKTSAYIPQLDGLDSGVNLAEK